MRKNERDTHFAGFAKLLFDDMDKQDYLWLSDDDELKLLTLLAQAAYDLAFHTVETVQYPHLSTVPDLTVWPDYSAYPDLMGQPEKPDETGS